MPVRLDTYWGDTCVEVTLAHTAAQLRERGFSSAIPIAGGFLLNGRRLARGERAGFSIGNVRVVASHVPVEPRVPRASAAVSLATLVALPLCAAALQLHAPVPAGGPTHGATLRDAPPRLAAPVRFVTERLVSPRREPMRGAMPWDPLTALRGAVTWAALGLAGQHGDRELPRGRNPGARSTGQRRASGTTRLDVFDAAAGIDWPFVWEVEQQHRDEIERCGEPAAVGAWVVLEWTLTAEGRVVAPRVTYDAVELPGVIPCVLRAVSGWRFPLLTRAVRVTHRIRVHTRT